MKKKILLVEDDLILGETIAELLEAESYVVVWVKDGQMAIDETFVAKFDLFLFDVNIPFINGFELLRQLREGGHITPAIFITANVDINSLKKGFDVGADDYIKKPFDCDELLIRIKAILKKSFKSYDSKIKYNDLVYDTDTQRLLKNNKYIHLTPSETSLLEYLLKNLDKIVTKDELIEQIHDDFEGSVEALRVWISKLKKLGFNITNIRGIGYRCEKV